MGKAETVNAILLTIAAIVFFMIGAIVAFNVPGNASAYRTCACCVLAWTWSIGMILLVLAYRVQT